LSETWRIKPHPDNAEKIWQRLGILLDREIAADSMRKKMQTCRKQHLPGKGQITASLRSDDLTGITWKR
jgi:hypothetical protein